MEKIFSKLLTDHFIDCKWYEVSYNRNQSEMIKFLETIGVMRCHGYDDNFREISLIRLDLYKLPNFNQAYLDKIKLIKNRFYLFDIISFFRPDGLLSDLVKYDIDVTSYIINLLIEKNS
jgi:hypothetical protein